MLRVAVIAAVLVLAACAARGPAPGVVEPELRRIMSSYPDSVVGVLVRVTGTPDAKMLDALERAGLVPGSIAGDVLTGRARAERLRDVANLSFVVRVELARTLRTSERR